MKFTRIKDDERRRTVRLPRLGRIRLGIKIKSARTGREFPRETEFFVVPDSVAQVFGRDPKELRIMLPVEDDEQIYQQRYAAYGSNAKLKCSGDGQDAERKVFKKIGDNEVSAGVEKIPCPSPSECDFAKANGCKAVTDFLFCIPEVSMGGVFQLSTSSITSDIDIRSGIEYARSMVGRAAWVPFVLKREERMIPDPNTGKMQKHWTVQLVPAFDLSGLAALRADNQRIGEWSGRYALPEPVVEGDEADTPIDIVEDIPGDEATPDVPLDHETTTTPSQPANQALPPPGEVDVEASQQARHDLSEQMQLARDIKDLPKLESIGAYIAKNSRLFTNADLAGLRSKYADVHAAVKKAKK